MLTQNPLDQERKMSESRKKLRWFVALSTLPLLGAVTAFGLVPQNELDLTSLKAAIQEIALPEDAEKQATAASFWRNERVQRGDTVVELLRRLNIEDAVASDYLRKADEAGSFRKLAVGKEVHAETNAAGGLISLRYLGENATQVII